MSTSASSGFLVVADITGYSSYLNDSELEHAQDVLATLLDLLIGNTRPPLVLSNLEGDAVLSYTIDSDRFETQAFVEIIETTYVAFKRAVDLMVMNTTCQCNACVNIRNLDLKFFVHHGEFVVRELAGREELVGADVNLIHRIMKNDITSVTGHKAYTFFTADAVTRLGLADDQQLHSYRQRFDDVGIVSGLVADMEPVWEREKDVSRLEPNDRATKFVADYPFPPEIVWGYLTNPDSRAVFSNSVRQVAHDRTRGRVAPGTVYECFHGDGSISTNTVLEWKPFERIVSRNTAGPTSSFLSFYELEASDIGTRLTMTWNLPEGMSFTEKVIGAIRFPKIKAGQEQGMRRFGELMEQDLHSGRLEVRRSPGVDESLVETAVQSALADLRPDGL